jgi:hypothetical protein
MYRQKIGKNLHKAKSFDGKQPEADQLASDEHNCIHIAPHLPRRHHHAPILSTQGW